MIISSHLNLILAVLVLIFVGGIGIQYFNGLKNAKKNAKYTVAFITSNWHPKNTRGMGTDFTFIVNDKIIEGICSNSLKKGTRYIVLYDSICPRNYILLYNHQLSNKIKIPAKGWTYDEIPLKLDSTDLKNTLTVWD